MTLNTSDHPIGIFDSGLGGLSVFKSIEKTLPEYDYIYLGDNARTPYGTRSFQVVYRYTLQAVKSLFDMGCHLIILACNTASAKALRTIQQKDLPALAPEKRVLGVIRPCTESIGQYTKNRHVGIFGTNGTVQSDSYVIEIKKFHPSIQVTQEACPLWVPLVENNQHDTPGGKYFIKRHIENLLRKDHLIDTIVLACTHYPVLLKQIRSYVPHPISILSQGDIVAHALKSYLERHPEIDCKCSKKHGRTFYTTENPEYFNQKAKVFLDQPIKSIKTDLA